LPPDKWFPAGEAALTARLITLPSGEQARIVEGGDSEAHPVVFLHGWGASAFYYRHILEPVRRAGYRVIALDLRGHGGSDKPTESGQYTGEAMAAHVASALDVLGLSRISLVAHSLGGGVALDVACHAPHRVASLTLLAPVGLAPVRFVGLARFATPIPAAALVQYAVPPWTVPVAMRAINGTLGDFSLRDVDEYCAPSRDPSFGRALRSLLHAYRFEARRDEELERLTMPVHVLLGGQDLLVRAAPSAARARLLARGSAEVVARAGHVLAEEVPAKVLAALMPRLAGDR